MSAEPDANNTTTVADLIVALQALDPAAAVWVVLPGEEPRDTAYLVGVDGMSIHLDKLPDVYLLTASR